MKGQLRLPAVLSVIIAGAGVAAVVGCGDNGGPPDAGVDGTRADAARADARPIDGPPADAACVDYCFPDGTGTGTECPFPTCATGPAHDQCPDHCTIGV